LAAITAFSLAISKITLIIVACGHDPFLNLWRSLTPMY
jgi:hypothetical protein